MSRRRQAVKRSVTPDAKFNSVLVGRLVNTIMRGGNKNVAQRIVYGALDTLAEKNPGVNSLEILQRSIENAKGSQLTRWTKALPGAPRDPR